MKWKKTKPPLPPTTMVTPISAPSGSVNPAATLSTGKRTSSKIATTISDLLSFFSFRGEAITTQDLSLTAYICMHGGSLDRIVLVGRKASFTVSHRRLRRLVTSFFRGDPENISLLVFLATRDRLKNYLVPRSPNSSSTLYPQQLS
jgi:hypothetical protein